MEDDFELQWVGIGQTGLDILASLVPRALRSHFGPFIDDVDIDCLT
jgi:hypothetical protein